jgi:fumarate reductase flavoprotein subunit
MTSGVPGHSSIVVIGGGTAGMASACQLVEGGQEVLVLEATDRLGGTLHVAAGHLAAAGTAAQSARGIEDSAEQHLEEVLLRTGGQVDVDLVRAVVEGAAETVDWLQSAGFSPLSGHPVLAGRGPHDTVPRTIWGEGGGRAVLAALATHFERAERTGRLRTVTGTRLVSFVREGTRIVAVDWVRSDGTSGRLQGDRFILATGGYGGSIDAFRILSEVEPLAIAPSHADGSGLLAAAQVGAQLRNLDRFIPTYGGIEDPGAPGRVHARPFMPELDPTRRQPWELHVNLEGRRFVAEDEPDLDVRRRRLLEQPKLRFWVIYDTSIASAAPPLFPDVAPERIAEAFESHPSFVRADSVEELAIATGLPTLDLAKTLERYSEAVSSGRDPLGRRYLPAPVEEPPFLAVLNHGSATKGPGGVTVGPDLRVIDSHGAPFENLWAVGEVIGGTTLSGTAFVSGMGITPAIVLGRRLGRSLCDR